MNDKKAKLLRKTVYGNTYPIRDYETLKNGQIINVETSLRSIYQKTKRLYNEKI
jgi:hypothetical protein